MTPPASGDLILYVTDHCELCDRALDMIISSPMIGGNMLTTVDISLSDRLFAQYGEAIPVLVVGTTRLNWPFTVDDIVAALQAK